MFPSFCAFDTFKIYSPHHQSLVPASLHKCGKEQRKLCQSILSWTLLSSLILITALYTSLPVHNLQWLPISTELNINFPVFHSGHILASASLPGPIACNYVSYKMNHLSFPGLSHTFRGLGLSALFVLLSDFCLLTPFKTNFFHVLFSLNFSSLM